MRFHLIDRITEIRYGDYIAAVKCVSLADDVFNEHFPGHPVFPGSLLQEGLAQLGGSFFELMAKRESIPIKSSVLSMVNKMKFRRPIWPGDRIKMRAEVISRKEEFGVVRVKAEVNGEVCAEGELTFSFVEVMDEALRDSRMELYRICMRDTKEVI